MPDGLMGSRRPELNSRRGKEFFSSIGHWTGGHAMRLNSWTDTDGLPVSSLNCYRPLRSGIKTPETIMSMGDQITDSVRPYAPYLSL